MAEISAVELAMLTKDLDEGEKMIFQTQFASVRKDRGTAVILALFLYDRIWLGDTALGILKLLTGGICGIWMLIDLFTAGSRCDEYNRKKAQEIVASLRLNRGDIKNVRGEKAANPDQTQIEASPGAAPVGPVQAVSSRWSLYSRSGPLAGSVVELTTDPLIIGRDPKEANLIISDYPGISRRHCQVQIDRDLRNILLEDCGSTNGTFLENGIRLAMGRAYSLKQGDRFYLITPDILFEVRQ